MEDNLVKCKCDLSFPEEEFVKHFQKCETFRKTFKTFDSQLGELLKLYSEPKENLIIIKVLLKQYIVVLDKKIKSR